MHVTHLSLLDFRSYATAEVPLDAGVTAFIGPNGQGKTNLVEAIDYVATLSSHRVAGDQALVRMGAERAIVRVAAVRDDRQALAELEITPGKSNRARLNRSPLPRTRELLGLVRTVLFSPDDQTLVKGDPAERRRFLDDLLVARAPRFAGVRQDYDRVLRQRNTLLKSAGAARRSSSGGSGQLATLEAWDEHLARAGSELLAGRLALVESLRPHVAKAYADVAAEATGSGRTEASLAYKPSFELPADEALGQAVGPTARASPPRCWRRWRSAARRSSTAGCRWWVRTATTWCSRSGRCRRAATPARVRRGRWPWRCGWRRSTCCGPTATIRC